MTKINTLYNTDALFPNTLHDLYDVPKSICYQGSLTTDKPLLAVVGTRRPSGYGRQVIETILPPLIQAGVGVVSGLAFGIDKLGHSIALQESGYTIAVVPSVLPQIYPASHKNLAGQIVQSGGAILTEYASEQRLFKTHFLQRNRLIAALSNAVLVIEAHDRSGTVSTVNHALELGRDIMTVPGSIFSPTSVGTNNMLQAGAHPVVSATDVAEILKIDLNTERTTYTPENNDEKQLINALRKDSKDFSQLLEVTGLNTQELQQLLSELELRAIIKPLGAQTYAVRT